MQGTTAPAAGATNPNGGGEKEGDKGGKDSLDPFTRKSSVKKLGKHPKKQQGSSRFRNQPHVEIQPLSLLKGVSYKSFCFFNNLYIRGTKLFLENIVKCKNI